MKVYKYVAAHVLWLVNAIFGVWFLIISRNTWLAVFNQYYINGSPTRANRAGLLDRVFSIILGFVWFMLVIYFESYLVKGVSKGDLLKRFAKATGPIVLGFFVVDLLLALIQGPANIGWLRMLIMLVELVIGITLFRFGWAKTLSTKDPGSMSEVEKIQE